MWRERPCGGSGRVEGAPGVSVERACNAPHSPSNARRSALSTSSSRLSLEPTKLFSAESITAPSNDEPQPQHNPPHAIGAL